MMAHAHRAIRAKPETPGEVEPAADCTETRTFPDLLTFGVEPFRSGLLAVTRRQRVGSVFERICAIHDDVVYIVAIMIGSSVGVVSEGSGKTPE